MLIEIICPVCQKSALKESGAVNRAKGCGSPIYCGRACAGVGRRKGLSKAERVEAKRLYDIGYRANNQAMLKEKKAARFQATYDPEKARIERKKNMARHVEYCRRPEYRQWKADYDKRYLAEKEFGEFAESALLLRKIESEIESRATRYEIYSMNGTLNKALTRRRAL